MRTPRIVATLTSIVLLATGLSAQVYEYAVDASASSFVLMGNVLQQRFTCAGVAIDPDPVVVGPVQECPSGATQIPVPLSGTIRLVIRRDPRSGAYVARLAGGEISAPTFTGYVGGCLAPSAVLDVDGLTFNLGSDFFPVHLPGMPVPGCSPTDNLGSTARMHILTGTASVTTVLGVQFFPMDCKSSEPKPDCGRLTRRAIELHFAVGNGFAIPFSYSVSQCSGMTGLGRIDYTGTLRFSGTLRADLIGVLVGPLRDLTPHCP